MSSPSRMLLNIFLLKAEFFRRVEDEHFHANIRRDRGRGELGHSDHQSDGEGNSPNRRLLAQDAEQRVYFPKAAKSTILRSLRLIMVVQAKAASPPPSMPVAAPCIVIPRHHTLIKSSGK